MKLEDFNYNLPEELIAQQPSVARDRSRMMVVDRKSGAIEGRFFYDIPEFFKMAIAGHKQFQGNPGKACCKKATEDWWKYSCSQEETTKPIYHRCGKCYYGGKENRYRDLDIF